MPEAPSPPGTERQREADDGTQDTTEQVGAGAASWTAGRRLSPADFSAPPRWIERLPRKAAFQPTLPSRVARLRGAPRGVDWRQTARNWSRMGRPGFSVIPRHARRQPGGMVLLWDVSGSMSDVRDNCLAFAYGLVHRFDRAGVFPFGTRIDDATESLRQPFPLARIDLAERERLWAGGTHIGGILSAFIDRFGGRWLRPDTTLLMLSDGWDIGSPEALDRALRTIRTAGCSVYWLNPLQGTPGFEPKTRALRIAKSYVAGMFPAATSTDFVTFMRYVTKSPDDWRKEGAL